jgi:dihydrolipoamide dehydrogenase
MLAGYDTRVGADGVVLKRGRGYLVRGGSATLDAAPTGVDAMVARRTGRRKEGAMSAQPDLAVVGGGPGGIAAAVAGVEAGLDVVLVDAGGTPGGTPVHAGRHAVRDLASALASQPGPPSEARLTELLQAARMRRAEDLADRLARLGVVRHEGHARLAGAGRLVVTGVAGETHTVEAGAIVLATGSRPDVPFGLRSDGERILTSDEMLVRTPWPRRLVVAGAGCVGVELAQIARRFGCHVTIVEMEERILPALDAECAAAVARDCRDRGIVLRTSHRLVGAQPDGATVRCRLIDITAREERIIGADGLLLALGRRPATVDLGLDTVEVVTDRRGRIQVDGAMATATPGIYAVGDLVPTPQLRHLAAREGRIAALHAAGRTIAPVRHLAVPRALDTSPPVATIGLTVAEARSRGHLVAEGRRRLAATAVAGGALVKVVVDAESERLLGVHAAGAGAERLASACAARIGTRVADPATATAVAGAGFLAGPAGAALTEAREMAPSVRAHVQADLKRRPLRRLADEAG